MCFNSTVSPRWSQSYHLLDPSDSYSSLSHSLSFSKDLLSSYYVSAIEVGLGFLSSESTWLIGVTDRRFSVLWFYLRFLKKTELAEFRARG